MKDLKQKRIEYNQEILRRLTEYLSNNPDIRFSQALVNLNIVIMNSCHDKNNLLPWKPEYYIEPEEVLKRMID